MNTLLLILMAAMSLSSFLSPLAVHAEGQSERILVDDFETPGTRNALGGNHGAFSDTAGLGSCYVFSYEKEEYVFGGEGYSLYIQWDMSKPGAYGGYWTDLGHLDLGNFNYLSFYIKGLEGDEKFKVGLRGKLDAAYETKIFVDEALKTGVTTEWQKVLIPLKSFKAIQEWNDVNIFSLNFEQALASGKGAVLIDKIAFEK
jgi:hypothetical protein